MHNLDSISKPVLPTFAPDALIIKAPSGSIVARTGFNLIFIDNMHEESKNESTN